ncbi:hypothetical protein P59_214 [Bacillus phage P59]|nr:hypothetical protein P59_214 [Bacillus phage P59]
MNIPCYLVSEGKFETALMPEQLLTDLAKSLRTKGTETVHLQSKSIEVEGLYIPAKGTKMKLLVLPDEE